MICRIVRGVSKTFQVGGKFDLPRRWVSRLPSKIPKNGGGTTMPLIEPIIGDPNETTPHTDVIREKLLLAMQDETLSASQREQARKTFEQMYPPSSDEARLTDHARRGF
jgi:hypothetical protein